MQSGGNAPALYPDQKIQAMKEMGFIIGTNVKKKLDISLFVVCASIVLW
jgi:hypothetical protein